MEVHRKFVILFVCIWSLFCIDTTNTSETGKIQTVCAGNQTSFFCKILDPSDVFIVIFVKAKETIGIYSPGDDFYLYNKFKDRYTLIKEPFGIRLKIENTRDWDQGRFFCRITYKAKPDVKVEQQLIVKDKKNSSLIKFEKTVIENCKSLTCNANGSQVKLKKPDNTEIKKKHIVLDSCNGSLTNGEFSCCLLDECSQGECIALTIEVAGENSVNHWIIAVIIGSLVFITIVIATFYCYKMIYKRKKEQTNISDKEQQSIHNNTTVEEQQPLLMQMNFPAEEQQPIHMALHQEVQQSLRKMNLPHEEQRSLPDLEQLRSRVFDLKQLQSQVCNRLKELKSQFDLEQIRLRYAIFCYLSRQSKRNHLEELQSQPNHPKELQPQPNHLEELQSQPNHPKELQSQPDHLQELKSRPDHVKELQSQPDNHEELKSHLDLIKELQSQIDHLKELQSQPVLSEMNPTCLEIPYTLKVDIKFY